jgi:hypothetical protein
LVLAAVLSALISPEQLASVSAAMAASVGMPRIFKPVLIVTPLPFKRSTRPARIALPANL